jgi:hypothetical protein
MPKVVASATARVARVRRIDFVVFMHPLISSSYTRFYLELLV